MDTLPSENLHVLTIGAGIAGLLLAQSAQADPAFEAKPTAPLEFHNGKTGGLLKVLPPGGVRHFLREMLRSLCSEGIEIIYGKMLSSVTFDNGQKRVIAHSATARVWKETLLSVQMDPGQSFVICWWERGNDAEKLKLFKERVSDYLDPWKSAVDWILEGTMVSFNNLAYWKTQEFDNIGGRVTLAGDVAHPVTPQRGQGLNHAIRDAMNLAEALDKISRWQESLSDAMNAYDNEMVKRGAEEVQAALVNTNMLHDWDTLMQSPLFAKSINRGN